MVTRHAGGIRLLLAVAALVAFAGFTWLITMHMDGSRPLAAFPWQHLTRVQVERVGYWQRAAVADPFVLAALAKELPGLRTAGGAAPAPSEGVLSDAAPEAAAAEHASPHPATGSANCVRRACAVYWFRVQAGARTLDLTFDERRDLLWRAAPAGVASATPTVALTPAARAALEELAGRAERAFGGELLPWPAASRAFPRQAIATVIDYDTGLQFHVVRKAGSSHADVQPLTAKDTAIMKRIYGGHWSWDRRAVLVVVGGRRIAASMNGMPHGAGSVKGNNFPGHFCIHFLGSRTHTGNRVDLRHQLMVLKAAGYDIDAALRPDAVLVSRLADDD